MPDAPPTYWNGSVVERIQRDAGVDRDTAGALWAELLLFLDVVAESKAFVSPPPGVDIAWHAFILHTRDYEAYCRERYGRVIHHQPTGGPDPGAYRRAYERRSARGTPIDPMIWPVPVGGAPTSDEDQSRPGQSGDFAPGAATIGGAELGAAGAGQAVGDFEDEHGQRAATRAARAATLAARAATLAAAPPAGAAAAAEAATRRSPLARRALSPRGATRR